MKSFYTIFVLLIFNFTAVSQIVDTCLYVHQENQIGGLDCYVGSFASFTADSYQWLNCDSLLAPVPGQTTETYTGGTSTNVALVVNYLGCIDTTDCLYACTWGIEELFSDEIKLVTIVDVMGRKTEDKPNTLLIYIYSDGTKEKVFRAE